LEQALPLSPPTSTATAAQALPITDVQTSAVAGSPSVSGEGVRVSRFKASRQR
jgi:hypothetical protein